MFISADTNPLLQQYFILHTNFFIELTASEKRVSFDHHGNFRLSDYSKPPMSAVNWFLKNMIDKETKDLEALNPTLKLQFVTGSHN